MVSVVLVEGESCRVEIVDLLKAVPLNPGGRKEG